MTQHADIHFDDASDEDLEEVKKLINQEFAQRTHNQDLDSAESTELVNEQYVKWKSLSAHPNRKAVKPWIQKVTDTHGQYGVDGDWLNTQHIDGNCYMDIKNVSAGDIIKVSGASHNNKKHRYYRVVAVTENELYYEPKFGMSEVDVIEEIS